MTTISSNISINQDWINDTSNHPRPYTISDGITVTFSSDISVNSGQIYFKMKTGSCLNGAGYKVNVAYNSYIGLCFPNNVNTKNIVIENIGVYLNGFTIQNYAGGLFNHNNINSISLIMRNCYCIGNLSVIDGGGLISKCTTSNSTIYVYNCYHIGNISEMIYNSAGGIYGSWTGNEGSIVILMNCYHIGTVTGGGGIVGNNPGRNNGSVYFINCYTSSGNLNQIIQSSVSVKYVGYNKKYENYGTWNDTTALNNLYTNITGGTQLTAGDIKNTLNYTKISGTSSPDSSALTNFVNVIGLYFIDSTYNNVLEYASGGNPYDQTLTIPAGTYTLSKTDSFGDGWNGGQWYLYNSSGTKLYQLTLITGKGPEFDTIIIPSTGSYRIVVNSGGWPNEVGWSLYKINVVSNSGPATVPSTTTYNSYISQTSNSPYILQTLTQVQSQPISYSIINFSSCFCKGTKITIINDIGKKENIDIENIIQGMRVLTVKGNNKKVLHVGRILFTDSVVDKKYYPYLIPKDYLSEGLPFEDTYASGKHCLLFTKQETEYLSLNLKQGTLKDLKKTYYSFPFEVLGQRQDYHEICSQKGDKLQNGFYYYHLVIEDNEGYYANGLQSESLGIKNFNKKFEEINKIEQNLIY